MAKIYKSLLRPNPDNQPTRLSHFATEKKVGVKKEETAPPKDTFKIVGEKLDFQSLLGGNSRKV